MKKYISFLAAIGIAAGVIGSPALADDRFGLPDKKFDNVTLRVATLPRTTERIKEILGERLEEAGIKLETVSGTSAEFLARLVTGRGQPAPFDIVEIADENYLDFIDGDFLSEIDLDNVPNVSQLDGSLFDSYRVAHWASQPALLYNPEKFAAAGINPPERFSDLVDERLKGRVLLTDISVYIAYYQIAALAYENGGDEKNADIAFDLISNAEAHSATNASAVATQLLQAGDVWATIWPTNIAARLNSSGVNISVVHPTVNGKRPALARGYAGIVKGSPHQEAAEYFINALLTVPLQEILYNRDGLIPVTNDVLSEASKKPILDHAGNIIHLVQPSDIANSWWPDYSAIDKRDWARRLQQALAK